jgi:hypothetical protein
MSSRNYTKHLVANTAPADLQIGDEYYDPGNNKLFKRVAYNGTTVQDIQISTGVSAVVSTANTTSVGPVIYNSNTITSATTFLSGQNGLSIGPMTITGGGSVNIPPGQRWVII